MITGNNGSKILAKIISCECKCRFDGKKCNSDQWWNKDKCLCECKKCHVGKKYYIWNCATSSCKNGKYLASIIDDSAITCDEIIDVEAKSNESETKAFPANLMKKNSTAKHKISIVIKNSFSLISIALLIAVSIYCYLIKHRAKPKHLLPFHDTNNELKQVLY